LGISSEKPPPPLSPLSALGLLQGPHTDDDLDEEESIPFEPFRDLCKRRFLWYYESYLASIRRESQNVKDQQNFASMPFEPKGNAMDGCFNYTNLENRLKRIKKELDGELKTWESEGLVELSKESTVAVNLQHQYNQIVSIFKRSDLPHDISLDNDNPFLWTITYFGQPMTKFDGGLLRIKLHFSPRFPDEQPRVRLESKIFHHHVAADGTLCYTPSLRKSEDIKSHVEAIIARLEEDDPAYDPREIVNPEASKLYWSSSADDKKKYSRLLRRSVQDSMEYVTLLCLKSSAESVTNSSYRSFPE
jgi:ubiquitin-conjugating enzyme E2 Z